MDGATVTLRRCTLSAGLTMRIGAFRGGPAVVASGAGACMTLTECALDGHVHAGVAEAGAAVSVATTSARRCTSGFAVHGTGSHLALSSCDMRGRRASALGVMLHGGSAMLRCCTVSGYGSALGLLGEGSTAEVHSSHLWGDGIAVNITGTGCTLLRDTAIAEPSAGTACTSAVHASRDSHLDRRSTALKTCSVQLERCSASHQINWCGARSGDAEKPITVSVARWAKVAMHLCRVEQVDQHEWRRRPHADATPTVAVTGGSRVCMTHSYVSTSGECVLCNNSMLRVADCRLVMAGAAAAVLAAASVVSLVDTRLEECGSWPMTEQRLPAVDANTRATLRLVRVNCAGPRGLASVQDSAVTAVGCCIQWLLHPAKDDVSSDSRQCVCPPRDALACRQSSVKLRGGSVTGFRTGLLVLTSAWPLEAVCADVVFSACEVGVRLESENTGEAAVDVVWCGVQGGERGIMVSGPIAVRIAACTLSGMTVAGVAVAGGAEVTVERCRFSLCDIGLWAYGVCSVSMRDAHVVSCAGRDDTAGMRIGDTVDGVGKDCGACGRCGEAGRQAALTTVHASGAWGVFGARCVHEGGLAVVALERVLVEGVWAAITVCVFGRVTASDVCAAYCNLPHVDRVALNAEYAGLRTAARRVKCSVVSRRRIAVLTLLALQHLRSRWDCEGYTAVKRAVCGGWLVEEPVGVAAPRVAARAVEAAGESADMSGGKGTATPCRRRGTCRDRRGVSDGELTGAWISETLCHSIVTSVGTVVLLALLPRCVQVK